MSQYTCSFSQNLLPPYLAKHKMQRRVYTYQILNSKQQVYNHRYGVIRNTSHFNVPAMPKTNRSRRVAHPETKSRKESRQRYTSNVLCGT